MAATHKLVGGSTGFVAANVAGLPLAVDLTVALVTAASSSIPDDLEKVLRVKHRRITHYPTVQIAVLAGLAYLAIRFTAVPDLICVALAGAVALGCVMHSCADAMTVDPRGIALLWPISRRGYHLTPRSWRVRVDSKSTSERVFFVVWSAFVLSYVYVRFRHQIPS